MDKKEEFKEILDEVQRFTEMRKALLLNKALRESPLMEEVQKKQMLDQMEAIRKNLQVSLPVFQSMLVEMENGGRTRKEKALAEEIKPVATEEGREFDEDFLMRNQAVWEAIRKRFCLNKLCKYSFVMGRNFKKAMKRCIRCGGQTISLISNPE